ncbi:MAG: hypothetical protein NT025_09775 [bacterium]|nr:hypothetical protein [bacterium]
MKSQTLVVLVASFVMIVPNSLRGQTTNSDTCKVAWADAWAWGNALAVKEHFEQLYIPHVSALLAAEKKFSQGTPLKAIAKDLQSLPGIKGVVIVNSNGEAAQNPEGLVQGKVFSEFILKRPEAISHARAPMTKRKMGGQIRFITTEPADKALNLMVRYVRSVSDETPQAAICLVLDINWLLSKIPSQMDSLAHENCQLLFWAASPTNNFEEQSLGIIHGSDTLWWSGRKDITVTNKQILWPFEEIEIHTWVYPITTK